MKFFEMYADTCVEDFVKLDDNSFTDEIERACYFSEFQFLNHSLVEVEISLEGGITFQDFLLHKNSVPLISAKMKKVFDACKVDNIFYKPVTLTFSRLGFAENYFLALPPRINCLNMSESVFEVEDTENFFPEMTSKTATKIVIDRNKVGNYKIFKLPQFFLNAEIIVTEDLRTALENAELSNVNFIEI